MNWHNVKLLIQKDWRKTSRNRNIRRLLFLIFVWAIGLPFLAIVGFNLHTLNFAMAAIMVPYLKGFILAFSGLMSITFASDAFAGEKEHRTIESFLALPCTEQEVLLAKILVPFFFAVLVPIIQFTPLIITVDIGFWVIQGITVFDVGWYLTMFIISPLVSIAYAMLGTKISPRFNNFKTASNVMGFFALPVIFLWIFTIFLPQLWDIGFIVMLIALCAAIDLGLYFMSGRGYDREKLILDLY